MDEERRLELKRQQFLQNLRDAADILLMDTDVKYVVCARLRDKESRKVLMGVLTNMNFLDDSGKSVPATPGMILDMILEAMLEGPNVDGQTQVQIPQNSYKM